MRTEYRSVLKIFGTIKTNFAYIKNQQVKDYV